MPRPPSRHAADDPARLSVFGVGIDTPTLDEAVDAILRAARDVGPVSHVAFVNADCLNAAYSGWGYKSALDGADSVLPDGTGVRMAARMLGRAAPENVNGTDLFPRLCEAAAKPDGATLYLLGGAPGVAARCAERMVTLYPGLRIVGTADGHFAARSEDAVLAEIAELRPDIVLVGMGAPAQDLWIARNRHRLGIGVAIGVGGLFDFYSGDKRRAPGAMRAAGVEWIWRLMLEPRRLFRRYVFGNPLFILRVWREARGATRSRGTGLRRVARMIDIGAAGAGLLAAAPLIAAVALAIRAESPGPVFFSQTRIGRGGAHFRLWKLRTMRASAPADKAALMARNEMAGGVLFKLRRDPRITRVGRVLRRFSLDEVPQLWNVLRGDMAIVGPRPALPEEVAQYGPAACERLRAKPGLTGLWQVSGRSTRPFEEQIMLDAETIARRSVGFDLGIMLRTVPAILGGKGAW